jgi:LmbE family N-acetylglucosaminyl deacetylase
LKSTLGRPEITLAMSSAGSAECTVLSVSPHPDDELLGAPATLMALRDAGWRVINLACSLGRPDDRDRRRRELTEACRAAGFELVILDSAPPIGLGDDLVGAQRALAAEVGDALSRSGAELVLGPSPHDGHHGHEVVGRAIRDAAESRAESLEVMFWGLWGELPIPNLLVGFRAERLAEIRAALNAHAGELARNRYDRLVECRAAAGAVLGPERVFGFGSGGSPHQFAELLTDVIWIPGGGWVLPAAREFDPARPLTRAALQPDPAARRPAPAPEGPDIGWWLHAPSARTLLLTAGRGRRPSPG